MRDAVVLRSWQAERREAAGVPIDLGDGGPPVVLDPIDLWPDDRSDEAKLFAAVLGGTEAADRYVAAGGNFATLARIALGTDSLGESQDSSASSEISDSATPSSPTSPDSTD